MSIINRFPAGGGGGSPGGKHFVTVEGPMAWEVYSYSSGENVSIWVDLGGSGSTVTVEASDPEGNSYAIEFQKSTSSVDLYFVMPDMSLYIIVDAQMPGPIG